MQICQECGMPVEKATTYHPYAACLMFKASGNKDVVQANLDAVIAQGYQQALEEVTSNASGKPTQQTAI